MKGQKDTFPIVQSPNSAVVGRFPDFIGAAGDRPPVLYGEQGICDASRNRYHLSKILGAAGDRPPSQVRWFVAEKAKTILRKALFIERTGAKSSRQIVNRNKI